jgi:hypothetical protein
MFGIWVEFGHMPGPRCLHAAASRHPDHISSVVCPSSNQLQQTAQCICTHSACVYVRLLARWPQFHWRDRSSQYIQALTTSPSAVECPSPTPPDVLHRHPAQEEAWPRRHAGCRFGWNKRGPGSDTKRTGGASRLTHHRARAAAVGLGDVLGAKLVCEPVRCRYATRDAAEQPKRFLQLIPTLRAPLVHPRRPVLPEHRPNTPRKDRQVALVAELRCKRLGSLRTQIIGTLGVKQLLGALQQCMCGRWLVSE